MLLYHRVLIQISSGYPPDKRQIVYALRTRAPVLARRLIPRLACVRPAASVHPEPGSNSSSLNSFISLTDLFFLYRAYAIRPYELTSGFTRFFKSFLCCTTLCQCTCCFLFGANCLFCVNGRIAICPYKCLIVSLAGAKVRRFFKLANFLRVFFKIFLIYFLSG